VQSSCFPRVVQTTRSNSKSCERTNCQSGSSIAVKKCAAQPCQSGSSQKMSFIDQSCQPANYMAKCCPVKAPLSKSYQTLEYKSIQCQTQIPESSSYRPLVSVASEPQLLESSSTYEPTCCVTGGLQMPSKWRIFRGGGIFKLISEICRIFSSLSAKYCVCLWVKEMFSTISRNKNFLFFWGISCSKRELESMLNILDQ
jgi:hypothetical protein